MRLPRRATAIIAATALTVIGLTACKSSGVPAPQVTSSATSSSSAPPAPVGAAFTHGTTVRNVLAGAKAALGKIGTYSYTHFDDDINAALSDLTPAYGARFKAKTVGLKDTVVRLKNTSKATKIVVGLASLDAYLESATVLATFTQTLTGDTRPPRRVTKVVALVGMVEINKKWLVNSLAIPPAGPPSVGTPTLGSTELLAALAAGENEIATLGVLRKAHFADDYKKWLSLTTGALHTKLAKAEKGTKAAFSHSGADLSSVCKAAAVESVSATKVELLVFVTATGKHTTDSLSRMTLEKIKGHWLTAAVTVL